MILSDIINKGMNYKEVVYRLYNLRVNNRRLYNSISNSYVFIDHSNKDFVALIMELCKHNEIDHLKVVDV